MAQRPGYEPEVVKGGRALRGLRGLFENYKNYKYYKNYKNHKQLKNAIFQFGGAASWGGRV
jgi:hypothetical protein